MRQRDVGTAWPEGGRDVGERHAALERDGGGGERVTDLMAADETQPHRHTGACDVQREAGAAEVVERHVVGTQVRAGRRTYGDDSRGRSRGHPEHERVVGIEHRYSPGGRGRQCLDQLALGGGDARAAAELAEVRAADVEDDADARRRDAGQECDVADAARTRLEHEVAGVGVR